MKCFQCKKQIENESTMVHIGDGDFVHSQCKEKFENDKNEFFKNIGNDNWYQDWMEK